MRRLSLLICMICVLPFFGLEVDVVSSFNIEELPSKLLKVKEEFKINRTCPVDYLKKSAENADLKKIIVFDAIFGGGATVMPTLPKDKLVLFVWEPGSLPREIYEAYSKVYTWDDSLIDGVKFFRFNYPYLMPYRDNPHRYEDKKMCAMVVGNWAQHRLDVVRYFEREHPMDLDCYGRCPPGLEKMFIHKGHIPGLHSGEEKISTLQNYRFCICFENNVGLEGYITEKIFSCFAAGCVPVYWGPNNIESYIPKSCFIDYRDFAKNEDLYEYLATMSAEIYERYLEEIQKYLRSEQAQIFSPQFFDDLVYQAITSE